MEKMDTTLEEDFQLDPLIKTSANPDVAALTPTVIGMNAPAGTIVIALSALLAMTNGINPLNVMTARITIAMSALLVMANGTNALTGTTASIVIGPRTASTIGIDPLAVIISGLGANPPRMSTVLDGGIRSQK